MDNKYNKPWKVEYCGVGSKSVYDIRVRDCNGKIVVETDGGYYPPDAETAEYIVKCVNERGDD